MLFLTPMWSLTVWGSGWSWHSFGFPSLAIPSKSIKEHEASKAWAGCARQAANFIAASSLTCLANAASLHFAMLCVHLCRRDEVGIEVKLVFRWLCQLGLGLSWCKFGTHMSSSD